MDCPPRIVLPGLRFMYEQLQEHAFTNTGSVNVDNAESRGYHLIRRLQ